MVDKSFKDLVHSESDEPGPDPLDAALHRQPNTTLMGSKFIQINVPARKPKKLEYFRVHPDPDEVMYCNILEHTPEGSFSKDVYLVGEGLEEVLGDESKPAMLLRCVNIQGGVFVWPLKQSSGGFQGGGEIWAETALIASEYAREHWIRIFGSGGGGGNGGGYNMQEAQGSHAEPKWDGDDIGVLARKAFRGKFINSADHPIVRQLLGEL